MQIETNGTMPVIPEQQDNSISPVSIGLAVDVGTTTVAVSAWLLSNRTHLATVAEKNVQIRYGQDVIKRISYATRPPLTGSSQNVESGPSALHYAIIVQLEKLFTRILSVCKTKLPRGLPPQVHSIVITGNTTMLSFVAGVPVNGLAAAPFTAGSLFNLTTDWAHIRTGEVVPNKESLDAPTPDTLQFFQTSVISDGTSVYIPPCIGAFIGADTVCAMLSAGFPVPGAAAALKPGESAIKASLLLADIGTNTEMALYIPATEERPGRILCTSAAAGPAFEAANISCGMSSVEGAIDKVSWDNGSLRCQVIGNGFAKGLCGSGIVSACATFLRNGYIDKSGIFQKGISKLGDGSTCVELTPAVYISQQDVRNLQLAKSAVKTGLQYMLEKTESLPVFCIAGGFGTNLNLKDAAEIGLIPQQLEKRCVHLGNGALAGASALLFSPTLRKKAAEIAKRSLQVNLAAVPGFQQRFLQSIDF